LVHTQRRPSILIKRHTRGGEAPNRRVRVAMAIQSFTPIVGGGELQLERLLVPLSTMGIDARILTRAVVGTPRRDVVRGTQVVRTQVSGESPVASIVYVATALVDLVRRRREIDVVHAHGALSPATIALGATLLGFPAVVTPLGAGPPGDLKRVQGKFAGKWRVRMLVGRAHFVALSEEIAAELRALGVPTERLHEIPNGFDTTHFHPPSQAEREDARRACAMSFERCYFLFVGRLHDVKRVDTVIRALREVEDIDLVIVGDGPERGALERCAAEAGVARRVRFTGFRDDVDAFMRAADVFVLPSAAEGMSNALVEAMASGLPSLVTSSIGGVDALVTEQRGIVVPPEDVVAWAAAMREIAGDAARRRELGVAASAFARASLSIDRTADRLASLYRSVARA
jgi:glycosyltransferase involved in cell wall biosynthesis